jgi:hypothetical protein
MWFLGLGLLISLSLAVLVWAMTLITGGRGHDLENFTAVAVFFGIACAFFVISRVDAGFQSLFDLPVFMTVLAFIEFGAAPFIVFVSPGTADFHFHGDLSFFSQALRIVAVGMVCFWIGATLARPGPAVRATRDPMSLPSSASHLTLGIAGGIYLASFAAKVILLRSGMYSYIGAANVYYANLARAQVWTSISGLGLYALIIFSIEKYYHPESKVRTLLLWTVFGSECAWGLISGMKSLLLINLLVVGLVSSMVKRKLRLRWLALALAGIVVIYPLINQYRSIVRRTGNEATTSINVAAEATRAAARRTAREQGTAGGWLSSGWSNTVGRLDLLESVALLIAYQDRFYLLRGDERFWMIPIYPFVPRFLWPGKPILDKGARFTGLLGEGKLSSMALTFPGDLYVLYGLAGIMAGMFILGLVAQWLQNPVKRWPSKRNLFIYSCLFFAVANWETDFFAYAASLIRIWVVVYVLAWIIYGPSRVGARRGLPQEGAVYPTGDRHPGSTEPVQRIGSRAQPPQYTEQG